MCVGCANIWPTNWHSSASIKIQYGLFKKHLQGICIRLKRVISVIIKEFDLLSIFKCGEQYTDNIYAEQSINNITAI